MNDVISWDELPTGSIQALWHPYILSGTVNLLQGDSTAGKSYLSQAVIAALTTGQALPNAEPMPPCNVIIQNAENSFSDVIKPRLHQLGADFSRIKSINEEQGRLSLLSPKIEEIITRFDAKLMTIDPLQAYMNMYNWRVFVKHLYRWGRSRHGRDALFYALAILPRANQKQRIAVLAVLTFLTLYPVS